MRHMKIDRQSALLRCQIMAKHMKIFVGESRKIIYLPRRADYLYGPIAVPVSAVH
jgi:hypothetical protein